jgi:hypothetical protein
MSFCPVLETPESFGPIRRQSFNQIFSPYLSKCAGISYLAASTINRSLSKNGDTP